MKLTALINYFFQEAFHSLWMNRLMNLLSLVTISISVFVLGIFLIIGSNIDNVIEDWTENIRVNIFLSDSISPDALHQIEQALKNGPEAESVTYISKDEAMKRFLGLFSKLEDIAQELDSNPLPASFELTLKPEYSAKEKVAALAGKLSALEGIEEVQYDSMWIERLGALSRILAVSGYLIVIILGAASVFTISNVIRLTVYSRSDEISIMRLVGATNGFIRGPFIVEGGLQGGLGALAGIAALYASYRFFISYVTNNTGFIFQFISISFIEIPTCIYLVLLGTSAGILASTLAVRKFIRI